MRDNYGEDWAVCDNCCTPKSTLVLKYVQDGGGTVPMCPTCRERLKI